MRDVRDYKSSQRVTRLVCRNTALVDVRTAGSIFVAAWKEFSRVLLLKLTDKEASCAGEIKQLVRLFTELILHEIEKILLEETSKDLFSCVSQSSVPLMQDLVFIGEWCPAGSVERGHVTESLPLDVMSLEGEDQVAPSPDSTDSLYTSEGSYSWHTPPPPPHCEART